MKVSMVQEVTDLDREAAETELSRLLEVELGAQSLQAYLDAGQESFKADGHHLTTLSSSITTTITTTTPAIGHAPANTASWTLPQDHQREAKLAAALAPLNLLGKRSRTVSLHDDLPRSGRQQQQGGRPLPLRRVMGRGKGERIQLSHTKSYVSQLLELSQALGWPAATYKHTRIGLNDEEYKAAQGAIKVQAGKELAALQALQSLLLVDG